jgi:hypothetical protein
MTIPTTGSDPARVDPDNQPIADASITPAPAANDPDDLELEQLRSAAKAEETAGQGEPNEAAGGSTPPAAPAKPQTEQTRAPAPVMIPKQRLDEALGRKEKAEQEAAYWRGQAEAREQLQKAPAPGSQQQPSAPAAQGPEDKLSGIHARQDELAKRFDDGEITLADYTKQNRALADEEHALREERMLAKVKPAAPASGQDELYLESMTAKLEQDHPWVLVFDQVGTPSDWGYLKTRAIENLAERNVDPTAGSMGKFELRREMARLADELGPGLIAARATAQGIALPGQKPAAPAAATPKPSLSPAAQARAGKLTMAAAAPPDVTSMTSGGTEIGYTAEQLDHMSDEDIAALPASVKQKILSSA